jgi:L-alanine-DL-glutamate epimerase-like enolase superfamily enzyme
VDYACELGEFMRMYDDPFAGIDVVEGYVAVPDRPGCGVEPVNVAETKLAGAA